MKEQRTIEAGFAQAFESADASFYSEAGWEAFEQQLDKALPVVAVPPVHQRTRALLTYFGVAIVALLLTITWLFASGSMSEAAYQPRPNTQVSAPAMIDDAEEPWPFQIAPATATTQPKQAAAPAQAEASPEQEQPLVRDASPGKLPTRASNGLASPSIDSALHTPNNKRIDSLLEHINTKPKKVIPIRDEGF